jgi:hypothetical protein
MISELHSNNYERKCHLDKSQVQIGNWSRCKRTQVKDGNGTYIAEAKRKLARVHKTTIPKVSSLKPRIVPIQQLLFRNMLMWVAPCPCPMFYNDVFMSSTRLSVK